LACQVDKKGRILKEEQRVTGFLKFGSLYVKKEEQKNTYGIHLNSKKER
jgi:hypothetical protein